MIVGNWITMRDSWSALATTDHDGVRTWDVSKLALGFTGANITCERIAPGYVYDFTVAAASDWWVSQRADWFDVSAPDSGTLRLVVSAAGFEAISGLTPAELRRLWRGVWVYCRRQSDGAIGVFDCEGRGVAEINTGETVTG